MKAYKLAKSLDLLESAGYAEECNAIARPLFEVFVNLYFILYAGVEGDTTSERLAEQFCAYADIAYCKYVNSAGTVQATIHRIHGPDPTSFMSEVKRLSDRAEALGATRNRWHSLNFTDMAQKISKRLPFFLDSNDRKQIEYLVSAAKRMNSSVHADAMSMRIDYRSSGSAPLEVKPIRNGSPEIHIYIWCIKALAEFLGKYHIAERIVREEFLKATGYTQDHPSSA